MTIRLVHAALPVMMLCASALVARAQDLPVTSDHGSADTNNAVIEGRVTLPSGFSADRNVRITLKTSTMVLMTMFTNKHGEFRFHDLSEGIYYVQAELEGTSDEDRFEPVVEKVALGRGIIAELTLQLRPRLSRAEISLLRNRVVSLAEQRQPVPSAAKKEYQQGLKFVEKGDVAQAADRFSHALEIFPEYLAARNDLGAQYLKLKRLDEAEADFRAVLKDDPQNFNARFNMGLVRIERRDYADAISHLDQAIAIDSSRGVAHLWLGFALLETGDQQAAERELTKAVIIGGTDCSAAHYHLGRAYVMRGDAAEALRSLRAYLQESPKGEYAKEARDLVKKLDAEPHARQ